ncbi:minor tail protein [Streptomyces phage Amethyst]|uniref:Minor tail protein n=1 Tax=Streptomyces phage Amethyst TaxID=2041205 RepID=A0A291LGY1_9CAUD|nr:tail protein [Streptomyces phage Amethyst]ATI18646.1 minor tail protein [Streptomyces phage Amethyst]
MAITSYPFDAQSITETDYSRLFREFQSTGVADGVGGTSLYTYADGTGMTVKVNSGFAIVRGHALYSTATETVTIPAANTSSRVDRVVLRLDPAANSITIAVKQGTAGSATPPALTQTDTGTYEFPLAKVTVGANVTSISAASVQGERKFLGNTVGGWTTDTRPDSPRIGRLGFNQSTSTWEFWNGTAWTSLVAAVDWNSLSNKPSTFTPATHSHAYADITSKPTTFPPSTHSHDWDDVTGKPTTFAPSTHSHTWSSVTSKPTTFPPSSHSHSQYLESGDTISWANGSKKPYSNTATDGTWYAVWVEGSGTFCRNTSARKFKENIQDFEIDPDTVLKMRPVIYDRKDQVDEETGELRPGRKGEVGLIADEAHDLGLNWIVQYLDGEIDALRYDLLGVALLPVVQRQAKQIEDLEARLARLEAKLS